MTSALKNQFFYHSYCCLLVTGFYVELLDFWLNSLVKTQIIFTNLPEPKEIDMANVMIDGDFSDGAILSALSKKSHPI